MSPRTFLLWFGLVLAGVSGARAVVVDDTSMLYDTAPSNGAPWDNVLQVQGSSGVYLGDGWIISAAHVTGTSAGTMTVGGISYTVAADKFFDLTNPEDGSNSDVVLFNIGTTLSGMADILPITTAISSGTQLTMIGYGLQRSGGLITVSYSGGTEPGYAVASNGSVSGGKGWGNNFYFSFSGSNTTQEQQVPGHNSFWGYYTVFNATGSSKLANDYVADSGGGVFVKIGGVWKLAATMNAIGTADGQDTNTVMAGDESFLADMSVYAPQITAIMSAPEPGVVGLLLLGLLGWGGVFLRAKYRARAQ